ncbi:hypothetical protein FRC03_001432 [Tulasnella sp. 419]|nr:hypothetical protein FRC03_001432 [Tulasnella sp. 419]
MLCYTTVDTNYHGPPPLDNPPTDLVTVSVKANISGSSVIRTVTLRRDTTISSLIEAILKIQDNNSFPTSITRFSSSNTGEASITSLTPRVAKTTWSYKTFDAIVTDTPTSWTPSTSTNIQSDHNQSTAFQHNYINIHDPFCKLWTRLTRPAEDYVVKLDQESMSLQFQNMQLTLQRTLRVQNDLCTHSMPASLGPLQLVNVARLADKLSDCIRSRGWLPSVYLVI